MGKTRHRLCAREKTPRQAERLERERRQNGNESYSKSIVMNLSYWEKDTYFSNIDVLIIGSGIVGLTAALELKAANPSRKIIVIERGFLPCGASSKNAGFSCFGSVSELLDDLTKNSEDNVFQIVEKRWKGLQQLRKNLGDQNLELYNNYLISL